MTARSETIAIDIDDEQMSGTFLSPKSKVPGVLFVHGWGGSQERDLERAKGIAGLGCVCLTFDLRGHAGNGIPLSRVTREDNLRDLLAAYDRLLSHPAIDTSAVAVVGTSYGGYLAAILTSLRPVRWLALRVPALYRDQEWLKPKRDLDKADLMDYRGTFVHAETNRALH
ncbi:MAG: alpha/beta fold hydrolase, partial [Pseudomonadota bacterium]|nr:alpha/beta fold hydrolase [Pseudomonadota bacterium]